MLFILVMWSERQGGICSFVVLHAKIFYFNYASLVTLNAIEPKQEYVLFSEILQSEDSVQPFMCTANESTKRTATPRNLLFLSPPKLHVVLISSKNQIMQTHVRNYMLLALITKVANIS
jgi:hypothetical protein